MSGSDRFMRDYSDAADLAIVRRRLENDRAASRLRDSHELRDLTTRVDGIENRIVRIEQFLGKTCGSEFTYGDEGVALTSDEPEDAA